MKRQLTFFLMTGLVTCASSVANANLLSNGNLDATAVSSQVLATPVGWVAIANKTSTGPFSDGMSSESFANVLDPGGNGLFFKPFQGVPTDKITASLYQDSPGAPGLSYMLTGWAGAGTSYIGLTDPTVKSEFHLEFFDSANNLLGDTSLDLVAAGLDVGSPTSPATGFGYHPYALNAIAPAGTVTVRALATMIDAYSNPAPGDQAFVVDAFDLEVVPEPPAVALCILGIAGLLTFRRRS